MTRLGTPCARAGADELVPLRWLAPSEVIPRLGPHYTAILAFEEAGRAQEVVDAGERVGTVSVAWIAGWHTGVL